MKKIIVLFLTVALFIPQIVTFAMHETTASVNEKYADYIAEALEKSEFEEEQLDRDNIYIIEKSNTTIFKNGSDVNEFYVAIPLLGTDDISYTFFYKGEYQSETMNSASMLYVETYLNSNIDQYIKENNLKNVTEVVSTIFFGRTGIDSYRVVADNETYFIPYHFESKYNLANDEKCALELGKAYKASDFIERLEKEEISFAEYKEQQEKDEKETEYCPVISLDENGDEVVTINGVNLDEVKKELLENIKILGFGSNMKMGINTYDSHYIVEYSYQKGCDNNEMYNFVEGLFDEITTQVTSGAPGPVQNPSYCNINLKHDEGYSSIHHQVAIQVWDGGVSIRVNKNNDIVFKVKNANAIIDFMEKYAEDGLQSFKRKRIDENTPDEHGTIDGFTKTDIIEFEYKLPSNADNSLAKEVAKPGNTINGTFEKYKENKYKSTYILTLSGNLGTISLYEENQSSLSGDDEYFSNNIPVSFSNTFRFENGKLVEYKVGKSDEYYELKMMFKDNNIYQVYFDGTSCANLKYTQLTDDTQLSDTFVEEDKEVVIREAKECADALYDFGLFIGTDKGYELEKSLTREESAAILVRLLGEEEKIDANDFEVVFDDVAKDRWSYAYVMYCYENNITKGTSSNTFSPTVEIDAEQFVALLMRLLGYTEINPDTALDKSVENKLLPAEMAEKLKEAEVFTRGEMVQIVYNSLKTQMDDGIFFSDYLLEKGVLSEQDIRDIK